MAYSNSLVIFHDGRRVASYGVDPNDATLVCLAKITKHEWEDVSGRAEEVLAIISNGAPHLAMKVRELQAEATGAIAESDRLLAWSVRITERERVMDLLVAEGSISQTPLSMIPSDLLPIIERLHKRAFDARIELHCLRYDCHNVRGRLSLSRRDEGEMTSSAVIEKRGHHADEEAAESA